MSQARKLRVLDLALDRLDDLRDMLDESQADQPEATSQERRTMLAGSLICNLLLALALINIGIHHGRSQCPAPNVARVGP
jgi:hypothetical protein